VGRVAALSSERVCGGGGSHVDFWLGGCGVSEMEGRRWIDISA
jgi:hypothetical protein